MNAPASFDLEATKKGPTPADLEITVRDERFARGIEARRWWLNGDPVATAWMNALSATFPRGEAFFIESVKAFRDGADPKLTAEIRAFVRQEINHTREHVAFNRMAADAGYDIDAIDKRVEALLAELKDRPVILNLAATMALEHFTAMLGHELLKNPKYLEGADGDLGELWKWHSAEEIEHKGVAYDTWLHATRDWSRFKRWKVKSLMMMLVTVRFIKHRSEDTMDLLRQDGLTGWKWRLALAKYLLVSPGFLRRIVPGWLAYFMPGFHPWNEDDRELIQLYEGDFEDALLQPAE
ncbi:metal-dependent hydrolase [Altererythrobacter sp. GH1-8]|uniref:metal-dependent hydrolase n=1 Tax=Altererythrobacter sp. GH1-8 TaxID=3349333 RepID=UPI00374D03A8